MSLLLDALRRASAKRDDPLAERLDVGRSTPAVDEDTATAPSVPDTGSSAGQSEATPSEDELALVPEVDERPAPESHSGAGAQPDEATGGSQGQSGQRERAAAAALLQAGAGGRRGRGSQLLVLTLAVLVVAAALAGGGWLWHMQSQQDIDTALGGYRPEPAQAELAANAAADSAPTAQSQTASNSAQGAQSTQTASDSSADSSGESSPADSGSENPAPAASSAAQEGGESDADSDDAAATVEATDKRPPAEPEEQLAQAAAQLAGDARATNGAAQDESASAQDDTASGDAAAGASEAGSRGDAADAGGDSGSRSSSSSEGRTRDLVETSDQDGGQRQSSKSRSAAAQPPQPMIKQADGAPLVDALNTGYRALDVGDLAAAEQAYARARRLAPDNRDALLGAASVRQRQGDAEAARRLYLQVLDSYPRDPHAQAALAALDAGATRRNESTLKMLLRDNPNAPALHYALGNVYATESRWSEARMAYSRAAQIAPDDPDYAYNLAVALDHLGRREAARRAYAQALSLASGAAVDFDPAAVQRRLQQLR